MSVVQRLKRDRFRSQAYAKAAQALRALAEPIDSGAQAKAIKGIGAGMANRIDVILKTGELKELEELKLDSDVVALRELRSVHGIGAVSAAKLVERGIRSLAQLRDAVEKNQVHLDSAQALGLRHCEEFSKRIPQAEMKEHHKLLEQCCLKGHPDLLLTVCGSYRRGRPDCGDIDVLISHPDYTTAKKEANAGGKLLHGFVSTLKKAGYVTGDLAFGQTKFMGVCRLSRGHLHRRLDIRCMPEDQYHFGSSVGTEDTARDNETLRPAIITRLEELPEETAQEVGWYLQDAWVQLASPSLKLTQTRERHGLESEEGMGKRFIWHGLARWQAYAAKKWLKQSVHVEDPRASPEPVPTFPPFLQGARKRCCHFGKTFRLVQH
ncbi:unnamed protein product [Durusdinium trenchii]|uniref:DNA polymerase n=1 Tax=Durusdinium trenchii TaxID=1381693 RepID=A0ABP0JGV4_9DINO